MRVVLYDREHGNVCGAGIIIRAGSDFVLVATDYGQTVCIDSYSTMGIMDWATDDESEES